MNDKREKLYNNLIGTGRVSDAEIGSLDDFKNSIKDEQSARQFHKNLLGAGFSQDEIGSEDDFFNSIASDFKVGPSSLNKEGTPYTHKYDEKGNLVGGTAYEDMVNRGEVKQGDAVPYSHGVNGNDVANNQKPFEYKPEVQQYILDNKPSMFKSNKASLMDKPLGDSSQLPELSDEKGNARIDAAKNYYNNNELQYKRRKKEETDRLSELSSSIDSDLISIEEQIDNRRNAVRNANWKPGMPSSRDDKELANLRGQRAYLDGAKELIEESQQIVNAAEAEKDGTFIGGLGRGFRDAAFDVDNWTMGLSDLVGNLRLKSVLEKAEKGEELTSAEEKLLDASVNNMAINAFYQSDLGKGYKAGQVTGESLPFMLEFLVNPISASGNTMAKSLLTYGLKKYGKVATNKAVKAATRLGTDALAAAGMTATTGLPGVLAETVDRMNRNYEYDFDEEGNLKVNKVGNESFGEALGMSATTRFLENQSEMIFNAFKGASKVLQGVERYMPGGVNNFMNKVKNSRIGEVWREFKNNPTMVEFAKRTQFHGIGEEYLEEVYNNFANVALGEMSLEDAISLDNNIDTFLGLAPTSVAFGIVGGAGMASERYKNRKEMERVFGKMTDEQKKKLEELQQMGKLSTNEDIHVFIKETIADKSLTPEQRRAEIEYAYDLAKQNAIDEISEAEVQDTIEAENQHIDSVTDTSTGRYAEVDRLVSENGEIVRQPGYIVGWIGEGENRAPIFVPEGMENTEENRIVLKPTEWDKESFEERSNEEVKALNEEMIRENANMQAEQESKYAPEVLNAQMQQGIPFNTPTSQIIPVSPMPEGNGWLVEEYAMDTNNKVAKKPIVREMSNDEFRDIMQAQYEAQQAVEEQVESVATPEAPMEVQEANPINEEVQPAIEDVATGEEVSPVEESASGEVIDSQVSAIPTKEDGSIDFVKYGKDNTFKELGNQYGEKMPHKVAVTAKALAEDVIKAQQSVEKAQQALDDAPIGRDSKQKKALEKAQKELGDIQAEADFWNEMDADIKKAQAERDAMLNPKVEVDMSEEPMTVEEFVSQQLANGNIKLTSESYKKETGYGENERRKFMQMFRKPENGGMTVEQAGERLMEMDRENGTNFFDQTDANAGRDALLNLLGSVYSWGDVTGYIRNNKEYQAQRASENLKEEIEEAVMQNYHTTLEDFVLQKEAAEMENPFEGFDITVKDAIFDEAEEEYQRYLKEQENGQGTTSETIEGDSSLLSEERVDNTGGTEERQGERNEVVERAVQESESTHTGEQGQVEEKRNPNKTDNGVQEWYSQIRLSGELDQNNSPFISSPSGGIDFGKITEAHNLPSAPVRLSMGDVENGYIHINRRHGKQIQKAGFNSIEEFVKHVIDNFTRIQEGDSYKNASGGINNTYIVQLQDKHNNTLFIQLSRNGDYWNVNSAGVFNKSYGNKKKNIWSASEVQNDNPAVVSDGLQSEPNADNGSTSNGTPSNTTGKDRNLSEENKANDKNVSDESVKMREDETPLQFAERVAEEQRRKPLREHANKWANALGVKVVFLESVEDINDERIKSAVEEEHTEGGVVPGWVTGDGTVYFFMPDIKDEKDVNDTYIHEVVGHIGVKSLLGEERFNELCDKVWEMMPQSEKYYFIKYPGVNGNKRAAADEYIAHLAEKEDLTPEEKTIWDNIVAMFREMLDKVLNGILSKSKITDKDISDLIKMSYANLKSVAEGSDRGGSTKFRKVYHGSSAEFDKFDKNFIGSGEGNSSAGYGFYVTSDKSVGRYYADFASKSNRKVLRNEGYTVNGKLVKDSTLVRAYDVLKENGYDADKAVSYVQGIIDRKKAEPKKGIFGSTKLYDDMLVYLQKEKDNRGTLGHQDEIVYQPSRYLYEVDIPDDNGKNYLDLDDVVPKSVKEEAKKRMVEHLLNDEDAEYWTGNSSVIEQGWKYASKPKATGEDLRLAMQGFVDKEVVSDIFSSMGYVGFKTALDSEKGDTFVIFDEKDLKIIEHTRFRVYKSKDGEETKYKQLSLFGEANDEGVRFRVNRDDAQRQVDEFTSKYNSKPVVIVQSAMSDEDIENLTDGDIEEIREKISEKYIGGYDPKTGKIYIFADNINDSDLKPTLYHENLHGMFRGTEFINEFNNNSNGKFKSFRQWLAEHYPENQRAEELFVHIAEQEIMSGEFEYLSKYLSEESFNKIKEQLKDFGYGQEENNNRTGTRGRVLSEVDRESRKDKKHSSVGQERTEREQTENLRKLFERVADEGLRGVVGDAAYDLALLDVYYALPQEERVNVATKAVRERGGDVASAVDEYMNENSNPSLWEKVVGVFRDMLRKAGFDVALTGNDVKYLIWRSKKPINRNSIVDLAEDIDKKYTLKVGEYDNSLTDEVRFRVYGGNRGYVGYSMSKRAANAREEGRYPKTDFKKEYGITGKSLEILVEAGIINDSEWHHTSMYGNKTTFYGWDEPEYADYYQSNKAEIDKAARNVDKMKPNMNDFEATQEGMDAFTEKQSEYWKAKKALANKLWDEFNAEELKDNLRWVEKEKVSDWLLRLPYMDERTTDNQKLNSIANIINSFENPSVPVENLEKNNTRFKAKVNKGLGIRDEYESLIKKGSYQARESLQDAMLSLRRVQEMIEKASGKKLRSFENAWMHENRLSSVVQAEIHDMEQKFYKPMVDAIKGLMNVADMEQSEVADYLMLKHGIERNREMAVRKALTDSEGKIDRQKLDQWYQEKESIRNDASLDTWRKKQEAMDNAALNYGADTSVDYSGLTSMFDTDDLGECTERAYDEVENLENAHPLEAEKLGKAVKAMNQSTLDKSFESGLMDRKVYDELTNDMYDYYIPLRGFEETTSDEVYAYLDNERGAFNAPLRRAKGRTSKSDNPIAYMKSIAESGIMQGNRNKMKQTFLNMIINNPSDLISVKEGVWAILNPATGEWEAVSAPPIPNHATPSDVESIMNQWDEDMELQAANNPNIKKIREADDVPYRVIGNRMNQHQVIVKRLGKSYTLTINGNPRLAMALNGQTNPNNTSNDGKVAAFVTKNIDALNRSLAAWYTTRNPDFVASNFMRDTFYTNTIVRAKEGNEYANKYHKHYAELLMPGKMINLFRKYESGTLDASKPIEKHFLDFMMNGGETGYSNLKDLENIKNQISKDLKGNRLEQVNKVLEKFDILNRAVENTSRFAAYLTSREMGRDIAKSVFDAKEISVNFNKKGAGGTFFGMTGQTKFGNLAAAIGAGGRALYVFFNAAIQGTTNLLHVMRVNPKGTSAGIAAMFLMGAVIPMLLDGDDEKEYYDLPEHVRRNHLIIPGVGDAWVSIPLPIEYRIMYGMGELLTSWRTGHERGQDIGKKILSLTGQALPLNFLEEGFEAFVPSSISPLWQAYNNKSWTGLPLYEDNEFNKQDPEYTKAYSNTDKNLVKFTKALYEWTFDEENQESGIDLNPAIIENIVNGYFSGAFKTLSNLSKTLSMVQGDREFDWRNIPVGNRIFKTGDKNTKEKRIANEYFENMEKLEFLQSRERRLNKVVNGVSVPKEEKLKAEDDLNIMKGTEVYQKFISNTNSFKNIKNKVDGVRRQIKYRGTTEELEQQLSNLQDEANKAVK